ncbi:glycosyltransferase family 2 protein, partial [Campylobacter coli]|nr:glycosyltransferase family 2 protein [Campylobacter coli]
MPKISIILPTFNVEKYIAKAIESCINQTFKDIEIIVVDDCGSDKSINIAKEYAKKDERIKIIHNEKNLGLLRARYEGVKAANSLYIMFLDPDDYLELEACEEVSKYLDQNNDLICF